MNVSVELDKLKKKALSDGVIKEKLLLTRTAEDPVEAFCKLARKEGCEIYEVDLILAGEELYTKIRRGTNGGGENAPKLFGEDDFYEMFFADFERESK